MGSPRRRLRPPRIRFPNGLRRPPSPSRAARLRAQVPSAPPRRLHRQRHRDGHARADGDRDGGSHHAAAGGDLGTAHGTPDGARLPAAVRGATGLPPLAANVPPPYAAPPGMPLPAVNVAPPGPPPPVANPGPQAPVAPTFTPPPPPPASQPPSPQPAPIAAPAPLDPAIVDGHARQAEIEATLSWHAAALADGANRGASAYPIGPPKAPAGAMPPERPRSPRHRLDGHRPRRAHPTPPTRRQPTLRTRTRTPTPDSPVRLRCPLTSVPLRGSCRRRARRRPRAGAQASGTRASASPLTRP